jgi:hypothetical protein
MRNLVKARTPILALILFVFAADYTFAANKVVVVPMGVDTASGLAEFAGGSTREHALTGTGVTYLSVQMTPPSSGKIIVNASGSLYTVGSNAGFITRCSIQSGERNSNAESAPVIVLDVPSHGTAFDGFPFASTRGFDVEANTTYFFNLNCLSTTAVTLRDPTMTAMFFPS